SASGALAAMASPDTTPPASFLALRPTPVFSLPRRRAVRFRWEASSDSELEGYRLVVDGKTTIVDPDRTSSVVRLGPGPPRWSISAYALSGNATAARW